jgi:hypothetical protein
LIGPQGIPGIGVATVTVSDTPPAGAPDATLWWESSTGLLYVFYNDGSSRQWVVAAPQPDISTFVQKRGDTLTGPLILNADPTNPLGAATKQYVDANAGTGGGGSAPPVSNSNPIMDGVAAPGSLTGYSRGDHVHPSDTSRVAKSGDTMTGALAVTNGVTVAAAAWPSLTLNRTAAGGGSIITGQMAGVARWDMRLGDQDAESGGNAGSSFLIYRYNDAGSPVDAPLSINRASGLVSVNNLAVNAVGIGFRLIASQYGVLFDNDDNNFYILLTNQYDPNGSLNGFRPFSIALNSGAVSCANGLSCNTLNVASNASVGGQMQVNSGVLSVGYRCRAGTSGGYGGNNYNLNWVVGTGMNVWVDTSNLGTIFFSSDYRIKKDVGDLPGMWAKVKALRPIKYTQAEFSPPSHLAHIEQMKAKGNEVSDAPLFAADNIERWGFVAHELQTTLTGTAASGVKDAPDTIQAPNPLTVIAALTKALQEAMTRIEALEARAGAR